ADTDIQISDAASRADVIGNLMRGVADITLRERTVRAAARWADQSGGQFYLYGRGWDERAEFARFAKGFVKHGRELGRAFRAATISLHAGTNSALHQRVLDGLCAGGFFLIQEKTSDSAHETSMAVYRYLLKERPSVPFVMKAEYLPAPHDERYREMLRIRGVDPERGFPFDESQYKFMMFHGGRGRLPMASGYWPEYQQVVYRDPDHLVERIDFFLQHAEQRRELAREMRAVVLANFTYDAFVRNILAFVQDGLAGRGEPPWE
ncbi:MAG: glycosyltransferase family 1 protein, partial [Planctomycetes bacterium]|nr:glycosyltransferase family 1 protein [Planctomycetota bacterium]